MRLISLKRKTERLNRYLLKSKPMPVLIEDKKYFEVLETAKAMDVTPQTVRDYIKTGKLRAIKKRVLLITEDSLREYATKK